MALGVAIYFLYLYIWIFPRGSSGGFPAARPVGLLLHSTKKQKMKTVFLNSPSLSTTVSSTNYFAMVQGPSGVQGDRHDAPDAGVTHEPNVETPRAAVPPGLPPGYSKVVIRAKTGSGSTYLRYHTPGKTKLLDSRPKCWAHYRAAQ